MRIAMIGSKGLPATIGGVERHVAELSTRLAASGFDVVVYARPWYLNRLVGSHRTWNGVRVRVTPSLPTKHLDAISHTLISTIHAMVRERPAIYHFHGVGPALCAWLPRLFRPRARVVVTFHCVDRRHEKWGRLARWMLACGEWAACRFPHETITVGRTLQAYCARRYGRKAAYIPNGGSVSESADPLDDQEALQSFMLVPGKYVLVVTRLVAHKEVHTTIAAFRRLLEERPDLREYTLAIVGSPAFTDAYADSLVLSAGGDTQIQFLGHQRGPALDALYRNAALFVHASRSEGLPIVLLEAAGSGLVSLVSDIPEHREITERIGGVLFRTGDVHDLQAKLEVLLNDIQSLPALGGDMQRAVARYYHWDHISAATAQRYRLLFAAEEHGVSVDTLLSVTHSGYPKQP